MLPFPDGYPAVQAAPLLCAGLIGYRALRMCGDAERLGLYGFGAAAHILAQVARFQGRRVFAFVRPGDTAARDFALRLGAEWAAIRRDAAASRSTPRSSSRRRRARPTALAALAPGWNARLGGIHMSDIPSFPYELLWHERTVRSVANLTRDDGHEFLSLAPQVPVRTEVTQYPLEQTEQALDDLRAGRFTGAAVVVP